MKLEPHEQWRDRLDKLQMNKEEEKVIMASLGIIVMICWGIAIYLSY